MSSSFKNLEEIYFNFQLTGQRENVMTCKKIKKLKKKTI